MHGEEKNGSGQRQGEKEGLNARNPLQRNESNQ